MIESSSSSGDSDTNNKFDQINLMENKNPMVRLVFFGKLKKMIADYRNQKLNDTDRKLLRGLFVKRIRDFDEDYKERMKDRPLIERLVSVVSDNESRGTSEKNQQLLNEEY